MKDRDASLEFMRVQLTSERQKLDHQLKMVEMFPETKWASDMHKECAWTQLRIEYYLDAIEALEKLP